MEINIPKKHEDFLKKVLNKQDLTPLVERLLEQYIERVVRLKYRETKTVDEMIDALENN